jgi:hypothetical protein
MSVGAKTKTPAGMLALQDAGRSITQAILYAGRHCLSRGKVRKFAVRGAATEWQGKSQNAHPYQTRVAPSGQEYAPR